MATVKGMEFSHSVNGTSLSMAVARGKEKSMSLFLLLPQTCQWSGNKGLRFRSRHLLLAIARLHGVAVGPCRAHGGNTTRPMGSMTAMERDLDI